MQNRKTYAEQAKKLISELSLKIEELEEKTKSAREGITNDMEQYINELKHKRGDLHAELEKLKNSGAYAYDDIKAGFENAFNAVSDAMEKARTHFK